MYYIYKEATFSAAHRLRDYHGKCERLHGHNWKVRVYLKSETLDDQGMVVDFSVLKEKLNKILDYLDHKYLNEIPPFDKINPSAENIAKFIFDRLSEEFKERVRVHRVMVWESEGSCAIYEE